MMWFPELFDRFEYFEKEHPGDVASVCEVSGGAVNGNSPGVACPNHIDDSVFLHTLIVGLACIPTSFWLPLCVHRLGAKFFLGKNLTSSQKPLSEISSITEIEAWTVFKNSTIDPLLTLLKFYQQLFEEL